MATEKRCVRCEAVKPTSEFHKRAKARDGLNPACKDCICAERRAYTAINPAKLAEQRKRYLADETLRAKNIERQRLWREANREHRAAYRKQYDQENAADVAVRKRNWYLRNREYILAWPTRNPERSKLRFDKYREAHREELAEAQRRRRVDKLGLTIADVDVDSLWTGVCGICDESMDGDLRWPHPQSKSIDHIIPLVHGGTHERHNLQWAHLRCNISKGARAEGAAS